MQEQSSPMTPLKNSTYQQYKEYLKRSAEKVKSLDYQARTQPFHSRVTDIHNNPFVNGREEDDDEYIALVPSRWSQNGWKYVKREPSNEPFFSNPNRVNFTGFNFKKNNRSMNISPERERKQFSNMDAFRTTYQEGFSP